MCQNWKWIFQKNSWHFDQNYKRIELKKIEIKNEIDVVTTIENEYKTKSFINYLTIVIV